MRQWTPHRIIALALGLWVAFAPAAGAVPSAPMPMQTVMPESAGFDDCDHCPDDGMVRDACAMMCANSSAFAIVPQHDGRGFPVFRAIEWPQRDSLLAGRIVVPDPGPPRTVSLR